VDCACQTLPQNASSKDRPWTAAASLHIGGRANDGALCFDCANKRREMLGKPVEGQQSQDASPAPVCEATLKKVCINKREYSWEVGTVDSLLAKWVSEYGSQRFKSLKSLKKIDIKHLVVTVNNALVPAANFSSTPISDGDNVFIVLGMVAGG
jgi:sulfur carrier protein ThiS